jgi:phage terminase small subunit
MTARKPQRSRRRERFAEEYLIDLNGTQAAIRAGYSVETARRIAYVLLEQPAVKALIDAEMERRAARTRITQDRVLEELSVVAFSNITDYRVDAEGNLSIAPNVRPDAIRGVASFKRKVRTIPQKDGESVVEIETELRLWNKPDALKMSGQHLGMYTEKHEVTLPPGTGVLAVPIPPTSEQWTATARAQQAALSTAAHNGSNGSNGAA